MWSKIVQSFNDLAFFRDDSTFNYCTSFCDDFSKLNLIFQEKCFSNLFGLSDYYPELKIYLLWSLTSFQGQQRGFNVEIAGMFSGFVRALIKMWFKNLVFCFHFFKKNKYLPNFFLIIFWN